MTTSVHWKNEEAGGVLCGAHRPKSTTEDPDEVTCPLCLAIFGGRRVLEGFVHAAQRHVTQRLAEAQRDPAVRVLTRFVQQVVRADRELRAARRERGSTP